LSGVRRGFQNIRVKRLTCFAGVVYNPASSPDGLGRLVCSLKIYSR
jgi:hypothetical protein